MPDSPDIEAALRQEREAIARMLRAEAVEHDNEATDLRDHYEYAEIAEEAWLHDCDARTLRRLADLILARTPTVAVEEAPEIAF